MYYLSIYIVCIWGPGGVGSILPGYPPSTPQAPLKHTSSTPQAHSKHTPSTPHPIYPPLELILELLVAIFAALVSIFKTVLFNLCFS